MYCTASLRPWAISLPWSDVGPVRSTRLPSLMVDWASAGAAAARPATSRPNRRNVIRRFIGPSFSRVRTLTCIPYGSVGVRPQGPVALDPRPDLRESLRLVHQEEDDGQAENDVPRRGDQAERL